eukprot:2253377-Rhodomonas_salina.1
MAVSALHSPSTAHSRLANWSWLCNNSDPTTHDPRSSTTAMDKLSRDCPGTYSACIGLGHSPATITLASLPKTMDRGPVATSPERCPDRVMAVLVANTTLLGASSLDKGQASLAAIESVHELPKALHSTYAAPPAAATLRVSPGSAGAAIIAPTRHSG